MRQLTRRMFRVLGGVVVLAAAPITLEADVIYDTTAMTDEHTYDAFGTTIIGGEAFFFGLLDMQTCDDFMLEETHRITHLTGDYVNFTSDELAPEGGVLVEFFEDLGGFPSEDPTVALLAAGDEVTATAFDDHTNGGQGVRLQIDLSQSDVVLLPGIWWLSMTPVDETPVVGDLYAQAQQFGGPIGSDSHVRNGGVDHGNGYDGFLGVDDWTPSGDFDPDSSDSSMKIEGELEIGGTPGDLDGDGIVGTADLLLLLGAWGGCPPKGNCPADLDSDNVVGTPDLLILLGNWG